MGIPYSREINQAFEQVTPLVAAGFEVLQTTKNIAILLACIQVLTVILLGLLLLGIFALLCTVNPDLDRERQELVTPAVQWLASWWFAYGTLAKWLLRVLVVAFTIGCGSFVWHSFMSGSTLPGDGDQVEQLPEEDGKDDAKNGKNGEKQEKKKKDKKKK